MMKEFIRDYCNNFTNLISSIWVADNRGNKLDTPQGIEMSCNLIKTQTDKGNKIMFIGNGGSAAISSHMAIDFWKNGGMKSLSFNDGPLLTCIGNDYGYKHVFKKPIEMFSDTGDILIAISSSGISENILLGVQAARSKGCKIITLSGFDKNNSLFPLGEFNFYVPSKSYGPVEVIHQYICHCILDTIIDHRQT